jgi:hypothetical protein
LRSDEGRTTRPIRLRSALHAMRPCADFDAKAGADCDIRASINGAPELSSVHNRPTDPAIGDAR